MNNYLQAGDVLTLAVPYDVVSGAGFQVGSIFAVATTTGDFDATESVEGKRTGVFSLAKTSAQAWTVGQKIYWNDSTKKCDTDGTVGMLIGVATAVAANPSSTGNVALNGTVPSASEGPEAAIVSLTDNSGGATADNTIGVITGFTPSVAWNGSSVYPSAADATAISAQLVASRDAVKELATKTNAILAALRDAGVILP